MFFPRRNCSETINLRSFAASRNLYDCHVCIGTNVGASASQLAVERSRL